MKNLFKIVSGVALVATLFVTDVQASGVSQTIAAAGWTNVVGIIPGLSAKISSFTLISAPNTAAVLKFYDTPTYTSNNTNYGAQFVTNAGYAYYTQYPSNVVTTYTNYYGVTNNLTNLTLITVSNWTAAATNTLQPKLTINGLTNLAISVSDVNFYFTSGVWVTNAGTGAGTIIMDVIQ